MTKEGFFVNYIKQIERSDSILRHSTFVIRYSAVQINSRSIGSLDAEVYLTPYSNGIDRSLITGY
ncbi:MAG: hypothetical protein DRI24_22855 [Deltaproteobacteria bacterium]|nr:MAG: hypothetical protein DRI24_22855 [Deltaproteobacteria bacterium]